MDMIESYALKYNFGEWNARIEKYLNRLLSKSTDYFANQFNNGELEDTNSEYGEQLKIYDEAYEKVAMLRKK